MKKIIAILTILYISTSFAQQKGEIKLVWMDKSEIAFGTFKITAPKFQSDFYYLDSYKKTITFNLTLAQSNAVDEKSLQITNLEYESISAEQLGDLDRNLIPNYHNASLKNNLARDKNFAFISLSPIIKEDGAYKTCKIKDCPVNCVGAWDDCKGNNVLSPYCGDGTQKYKVTTLAKADGTICEAVDGASKPCKLRNCNCNDTEAGCGNWRR